jgi:tetratricopeptide (TPR) repeat protein
LAIRVDNYFKEAYNAKGSALKCLGEYEQAIQVYDQAIKIDPNFKEVYLNKGNALRFLG